MPLVPVCFKCCGDMTVPVPFCPTCNPDPRDAECVRLSAEVERLTREHIQATTEKHAALERAEIAEKARVEDWNARRTAEEENARLTRERDGLREAIKQYRVEANNLEAGLRATTSRKSETVEELELLRGRFAEADAKFAEIRSLGATVSDLTRERDSAHGRITLIESLAESAADALERAGEVGEAQSLRKLMRKEVGQQENAQLTREHGELEQDYARLGGTVDDLRRALITENPRCAICGTPATCFGRYEDAPQADFACDTCCGHGCEDGHCDKLGLVKMVKDVANGGALWAQNAEHFRKQAEAAERERDEARSILGALTGEDMKVEARQVAREAFFREDGSPLSARIADTVMALIRQKAGADKK